ncbi:zinc finger ZPR1 [Brachionus plicatilis]|uniref:Zinc finger ZPR1 n=1 Tax=Brachionus plicatilis TaxID=10195 RepID=A0A3M7PMR8_BRAPC|nr:zinc finger ZPR1 [Brachionus plicatilis]
MIELKESATKSTTIFNNLDASEDNYDSGITELDSVCMNCYKTGRTKLMLTRIPFYRDVIISSFCCEHCHYVNNGIESANRIQQNGVKYKLLVSDAKDLNRELVKSDYALFKIPIVNFEIPEGTQKGYLTTIEGIIDRVITNLGADIELRKEVDPDSCVKLAEFVQKLKDLKDLKLGEFEVILDDPSGDSFIENPYAPAKDPKMSVNFYKRTQEQNETLGLTTDTNIEDEIVEKTEKSEVDLRNEVVQFHNNCPNCNAICETNMKLTDIPYFKSVIIMCTVCENCGVKSSEVKSGSGIEEKGVRYTLKLTDPSDLDRDVLKSDEASFEIPQVEFFMGSGTLGGKFTTIEGILKDVREQLSQNCPFAFTGGDSQTKDKVDRMKECLDKLEMIENGHLLNVTIIIDDPSGNSYLQNVYAPDEDPNMKVERYERNYEQNETLGLNDLKTENYQDQN